MSNASRFVYVTYIRTTPEKLWAALTEKEFTTRYWMGTHQQSEWKKGPAWTLVFADGTIADTGEILDIDPPGRLVLSWRNEFRADLKDEGHSRCSFALEPMEGCVKLTIEHTMDRPGSKFIDAVSGGWPQLLSNLKSLLETGEIVLTWQ